MYSGERGTHSIRERTEHNLSPNLCLYAYVSYANTIFVCLTNCQGTNRKSWRSVCMGGVTFR